MLPSQFYSLFTEPDHGASFGHIFNFNSPVSNEKKSVTAKKHGPPAIVSDWSDCKILASWQHYVIVHLKFTSM